MVGEPPLFYFLIVDMMAHGHFGLYNLYSPILSLDYERSYAQGEKMVFAWTTNNNKYTVEDKH